MIDLSATPFFLRGSGYAEGTLFPWTIEPSQFRRAISADLAPLPEMTSTRKPSSKTKRHGKGYRFVPLFPELLPYLRDCFEQAEEGATHVITRYRGDNANLRTQLLRIVEKAGVEPWQKPFQNLRSSRETELTNQFPIHVVADWLGNTPQVADKHYLQTTERHFQKAADCADTVQNCANSVAEQSSTAEQETKKTPTIAEVLLADSLGCSPMLLALVPPRGVEPLLPD